MHDSNMMIYNEIFCTNLHNSYVIIYKESFCIN
jgi:hypothetical protein